MSAGSMRVAVNANSASAVLGMKYAETGSVSPLIVECLKTIFPRKPWAALADLLGLKERRAKHRMATSRQFTADELATLLRSEDGFKFLVAVMADARPRWWRVCSPLMEVAETQRMQAAARHRLRRAVESAIDADQEITSSIARAEAALCLQDQDFYRPHFDAARDGARIPHRTMGQGAKRR